MAGEPRLLFVVTEDWYFASHRLSLARAARDAGFTVGLATRVSSWAGRIGREGIELFPLRYLRRSSRNPRTELRAIAELTELYRSWQPSIAHHVAAKPIIYGGIAARRAGVPAMLGAIAGMGYVFSSSSARARLMRPAIVAAYRRVFRHRNARLIVQNPEDEHAAIAQGIVPRSRVRRIRGSGVDPVVYSPTPEPSGVPVVLLAARMLQDKGIREFVEAAAMLRGQGVAARFVLVGDVDDENPASIGRAQLERWSRSDVIEWWGHRADMSAVLAAANIVCLPSYREGLPKVLLEAAACGRAIVATDVPGCREIAIHGQTSLLVPPRDASGLAGAISTLLADAKLRESFGLRGRKLIEEEFTIDRVNQATLAIYQELLSESHGVMNT